MKSKEQIPKPEEELDALDIDSNSSVDDFIKELEAKEKDLHITADLTIEIEESDFDPDTMPDFVQQELPAATPKAVDTPPDARSTGLKTRAFELENEVKALQEKLKNLRFERRETQEKSDRRLKDFESYKYRMDRERRGSFIDQISNLAAQMLPVLDNLDRALDAADSIETERSGEFQHFYDGIVMVNQQIREVFAGMGVQPIATVGEMFDPNLHEAVAAEKREDVPPNTIISEMLCGYRIGNRVIRHSMVKVTTTPPNVRKVEPSDLPDDTDNKASHDDSPENDPPELEPSSSEAE
jgi:molecular chaperone GrpE